MDGDGVLILLIGLVSFVWHGSMRAREQALEVVRRTCREMELVWLDENVTLATLGLKRDDEGRLRIRRIYGFRYLEAGHLIREGVLIYMGDQLASLLLDTTWQRS
nr:conserved uncharacterized protein [uncultured bacterium]